MILIVSEPGDPQVAAVVHRLEGTGHEVAVVDADRRFEVELAFDAAPGGHGVARRASLRCDARSIELDRARVGWWRRLPPAVYTGALAGLGSGPAELGSRIADTEALEGVLSALELSWMNDPVRDRRARRRPLFWSAAVEAGLSLPRTLVTRDPEAALDFLREHRGDEVVSSALIRRADDWWGSSPVGGEERLSERLREAEGELVLQPVVQGVDVRVVVVGSAMFAVELEGRPADLPLDLAFADHGVRRTELPDPVFDAVSALMLRLDLSTASIDLRRTPEGDFVAIDLDPSPAWTLLEELTAWPVTRAVADALALRERVLTRRR
ncbi:hypothetical protein [Homoserinibacter sp. YIM 151385]|uniref:hypothetical protein n=1 Tax=Homoserinibacter sp. YIM 151385 TaxID=2985506 RepID=UPI0022F11043|nr:hypothetical protein [Homoserinibacter sp. YIM 151385]WBU36791.1 hypothetical protein OF852_07520 [Homoserinibacter sp. YIM 151385]